ncbi:MAG: hypothetical protein KC466_16705 [Myxococcales bacterium]|nr:hypothetical protein [Myxococcales bacterium]
MIDIRIGPVEPASVVKTAERDKVGIGILGTVVAARPGRRRHGDEETQQRRKREGKRDPVGARVLTILISDGAKLPSDRELERKRVALQILD